jgi:hypothetical protein
MPSRLLDPYEAGNRESLHILEGEPALELLGRLRLVAHHDIVVHEEVQRLPPTRQKAIYLVTVGFCL